MHHCNTNTYLQHYSIKFELAIGVIRSTCLIICFEPVFFQDLDGWVTYVSNKFISFWYIYIYIYIYIPIKSLVASAIFWIALFEAVLSTSVENFLAWSRSFWQSILLISLQYFTESTLLHLLQSAWLIM